MVLDSNYADLQQFPNKWSFGRNSETSRPLFCFKNLGSGGFRVSPKAPFIWKLLQIGILRAKDHNKNFPNSEVGGQAPATPTPPVVWVVLQHTDRSRERLFRDSVCLIRVCQCAKSYQMHAPLCMLMHLVINDSEKQIKSYFLHFSIWSKHVEVYVVRVCSDRF